MSNARQRLTSVNSSLHTHQNLQQQCAGWATPDCICRSRILGPNVVEARPSVVVIDCVSIGERLVRLEVEQFLRDECLSCASTKLCESHVVQDCTTARRRDKVCARGVAKEMYPGEGAIEKVWRWRRKARQCDNERNSVLKLRLRRECCL